MSRAVLLYRAAFCARAGADRSATGSWQEARGALVQTRCIPRSGYDRNGEATRKRDARCLLRRLRLCYALISGQPPSASERHASAGAIVASLLQKSYFDRACETGFTCHRYITCMTRPSSRILTLSL